MSTSNLPGGGAVFADAGAQTRTAPEIELPREDPFKPLTGRITGRLLGSEGNRRVYLTDDERLLVVDEERRLAADVPLDWLRILVSEAVYIDVARAVGAQSVIDDYQWGRVL